ncbi:Hypothetical_protein [Hexamita inflata]|uniref:Hypothetical_protein n=1 Tax=Hexamita inflata TaxID=28002 RepID=A0ABP1HIS5_9EUKA
MPCFFLDGKNTMATIKFNDTTLNMDLDNIAMDFSKDVVFNINNSRQQHFRFISWIKNLRLQSRKRAFFNQSLSLLPDTRKLIYRNILIIPDPLTWNSEN